MHDPSEDLKNTAALWRCVTSDLSKTLPEIGPNPTPIKTVSSVKDDQTKGLSDAETTSYPFGIYLDDPNRDRATSWRRRLGEP